MSPETLPPSSPSEEGRTADKPEEQLASKGVSKMAEEDAKKEIARAEEASEKNRKRTNAPGVIPSKKSAADAMKVEQATTTYLQAEQIAATTNIQKSIEYRQSATPKNLAYVPYLEHLLEEVKDKSEWLGDSQDEQLKEQALLQNTALSVRNNLEELRKIVEGDTDKQSPAHEKLRKLYIERSSRLTELVANVDEKFENTDLRDADLAAKQAQETIRSMTTDEAIDWVGRMMAQIDGNNWQSRGLKETYGKLTMACTQALQKKLAEEKTQCLTNPTLAKVHVRHCMELAKLFTNRGTPIDSDLVNIDFAADMAREAMDFQELALRFVEQNVKQECPIKQYVREHAAQTIAAIPAAVQSNSQVREMVALLQSTPQSIQAMTQQYAALRQLEGVIAGSPPADLTKEINEQLTGFLEQSIQQFETFLNGSWTGAAGLQEINAALGVPLSAEQTEAWKLLADIKGYGYDISDKAWSYVGMGAKIATMIASGIAVGVATGGLGVVAAALAGGAAMTAVNVGMNQQGFDDTTDALDVYGKDLATNTVTMGAARYLAAGRAVVQANMAGAATRQSAKELFKIAGQKGGLKIINSLDDASYIGTRLFGGALEGSGDTVIGASLDTIVQGGTFYENLQSNAMFAGLGVAEFAGPALRVIRRLPREQLHGLAQSVNHISIERTKLNELSKTLRIKPGDLLATADPKTLLTAQGLKDKDLDNAMEQIANLKKLRDEFNTDLKKLADEGGKLPPEQKAKEQRKETKPEQDTALQKPKDLPNMIGMGGAIPEKAMDIERAIKTLERSPDASAVRISCILEGENGKVGVTKQIPITVTYVRHEQFNPREVVDITIECPREQLLIKMRYLAEDHSAIIFEANTGTAKGYGFYSQILTQILRPVRKIENDITNDSIRLLTNGGGSDAIPNAVLGASEIGAARTRAGFINGLDASGTQLTSLRVDPPVAELLLQSNAFERALEKKAVDALLAQHPDQHPAIIAEKLQTYKDAHYKNARKGTPEEQIETMLEREIKHLKGRAKEVGNQIATLTNKEKRALLKPQKLSELSTEEYIALWRRLNPYFLSHVTRQGFRDHNAMIFHSGGMGEFHNGLVNALQDGKMIRPPVVVHDGLNSRDEASIRKFLAEVLKAPTIEEARKRLHERLHITPADAPNHPDETAVHFAAQAVADRYYGGESGNEVFFLYPADVLASQYHFAFSSEPRFTKPADELKRNDILVWPGNVNSPGIPLDAGIVFLPKNTRVDPETGSKYISEIKIVNGKETRVITEDAKLISAEHAVPAEEYWEGYFAKNPGLKPKHVIYYDGDPTSAVHEFQKKNNIGRADTQKAEGNLLGFDDRHVAEVVDDPRAWTGYDALMQTANRIIDDQYRGSDAMNTTDQTPTVRKAIANNKWLAAERESNLHLSTPKERVAAAYRILRDWKMRERGFPFSPGQKSAIAAAHDLPMTGKDANGNPTYSKSDLRAKMNILEGAGFNRDEADLLLRMGVCGQSGIVLGTNPRFSEKPIQRQYRSPLPEISESPMQRTIRYVDENLASGGEPTVGIIRKDGSVSQGYKVTGKRTDGHYLVEKAQPDGSIKKGAAAPEHIRPPVFRVVTRSEPVAKKPIGSSIELPETLQRTLNTQSNNWRVVEYSPDGKSMTIETFENIDNVGQGERGRFKRVQKKIPVDALETKQKTSPTARSERQRSVPESRTASPRWEQIAGDPRQPTLTRQLLDEGFTPKAILKVGDQTFHMGPIMQPTQGYPQAIMFVEVQGRYLPRILYKSRSDGGWRSCPFERSGNYSKGKEIHYTQETKPSEEILQYLENNSDSIESTSRSLLDKDFRMDRVIDQKILTYDDEVSRYNDDGKLAAIQEYKPSLLGMAQRDRIQTTELIRASEQLPSGFVPDFTRTPERTTTRAHTLLGAISVETYKGTLDGRPVEWNMASDTKGRVWVESIQLADSPVTSYGVRSEVLDTGVLTSKPLEYSDQADAIDASLRKSFNEKYDDITPLLSTLAPIRAYIDAKRTKNNPTRAAQKPRTKEATGDSPGNRKPEAGNLRMAKQDSRRTSPKPPRSEEQGFTVDEIQRRIEEGVRKRDAGKARDASKAILVNDAAPDRASLKKRMETLEKAIKLIEAEIKVAKEAGKDTSGLDSRRRFLYIDRDATKDQLKAPQKPRAIAKPPSAEQRNRQQKYLGKIVQEAKAGNRTALLQFMQAAKVDDAMRLDSAKTLLDFKTDLSPTQAKAILDAHNYSDGGNLREGYSTNENIRKASILMKQGGFTRKQAQLLMDTGICGNNIPPSPLPSRLGKNEIDKPFVESGAFKPPSLFSYATEYKDETGNRVTLMRVPRTELYNNTVGTKNIMDTIRTELGEREAFESLIVGALMHQAKIADALGVPRSSLIAGMKLNYYDHPNGTMLMDNNEIIHMKALQQHIESLRQAGVSDKDIAVELAGHIFHERLHDADEITRKSLLNNGETSGEVVTVTGQLCSYLLLGYKGKTSYDCSQEAFRRARASTAYDLFADYDIASIVGGKCILSNLQKSFPEHCTGLDISDPLRASQTICDRLSESERSRLPEALRGAIADSANRQKVADIIDEVRNQSATNETTDVESRN